MKVLEDLNVEGKGGIIKNMYWEQTVAMRVNSDYTGFQQIKKE